MTRNLQVHHYCHLVTQNALRHAEKRYSTFLFVSELWQLLLSLTCDFTRRQFVGQASQRLQVWYALSLAPEKPFIVRDFVRTFRFLSLFAMLIFRSHSIEQLFSSENHLLYLLQSAMNCPEHQRSQECHTLIHPQLHFHDKIIATGLASSFSYVPQVHIHLNLNIVHFHLHIVVWHIKEEDFLIMIASLMKFYNLRNSELVILSPILLSLCFHMKSLPQIRSSYSTTLPQLVSYELHTTFSYFMVEQN